MYFSSYILLYFHTHGVCVSAEACGQRQESNLLWSAASPHWSPVLPPGEVRVKLCEALTWAGIVAWYAATNEASCCSSSFAYDHFLSVWGQLYNIFDAKKIAVRAFRFNFWLAVAGQAELFIFFCLFSIYIRSILMYIQFSYYMVWHRQFLSRPCKVRKVQLVLNIFHITLQEFNRNADIEEWKLCQLSVVQIWQLLSYHFHSIIIRICCHLNLLSPQESYCWILPQLSFLNCHTCNKTSCVYHRFR